MSLLRYGLQIPIVLGITCSSAAWAGMIRVSVALDPASEQPVRLSPAVAMSDGEDLEGKKRTGIWLFEFKHDDRILTALGVRADGSLPGEYVLDDLWIEVPFYAEVIDVHLVATRADIKAESVEKLYGTEFSELSNRGLFEYHQRAKSIALQRMLLLGNDWSKLTDWDVQAVAAYLRATVLLEERAFASADDDVREARDWLVRANSNRPDRVAHAVETGGADRIVADVDALQGQKYARLWKNRVRRDCDDRLSKLYALRALYREQAYHRRVRIAKVAKITLQTIQSSINECTTIEAESVIRGVGEAEPSQAARLLREAIQTSEDATSFYRGSTQEGELRTLEREIEHLHRLLRAAF